MDGHFAFVACLSVLEHGVNLNDFFREMGNVIKHGGLLFISFDYWETPIDTGDRQAFGAPVKVFTRNNVEAMISLAAEHRLYMTGEPDLRCDQKVINWVGLDFTFCNLLFRRE
jgi:SAM-dependent methyltransferase